MFIGSTPKFQDAKITKAGVFDAVERMKTEGKAYLVDLVWHNLERVKLMYSATLGVKFPDDIVELLRAISTRHDIVHRNGKTKDGEEILVSEEQIKGLIGRAERFVQHIDRQISAIKPAA
jgi:hypothetical protein